jgi:hypothetical protein
MAGTDASMGVPGAKGGNWQTGYGVNVQPGFSRLGGLAKKSLEFRHHSWYNKYGQGRRNLNGMEKQEQGNSLKKTPKNPILVVSSQWIRILVVLAFALLFALLLGLVFGVAGGPAIGVIAGLIAGAVAGFIFYGLVAGP